MIRNGVADDKASYLFELETPEGLILASGVVPSGPDGKTSWRVPSLLVPGNLYKWRVRAIPSEDKLKPRSMGIAQASFIVEKAKGS